MSSLLSPQDEFRTLFRVGTNKPFRVRVKDFSETLQKWIEEGTTDDVLVIHGLYLYLTCDWCDTTVDSAREITVYGHGDWHISKACSDCNPMVERVLKDILGHLAHIPKIDGKESPVKIVRTSGDVQIWVVGSLLPKKQKITGVVEYCVQVFEHGVMQSEGFQKWVPVRIMNILNFTQPDGTVHYDAEGKPVQNLDITFNPLLLGV